MADGLDAHGNPMTGSPSARERFDAALDRLLRFDPAAVDHTETLCAEHPDAPMGRVLQAYLALSSTDLPDVAVARTARAAMTAGNEREVAHAAVLDAWLAGDWHRTQRAFDDLLAAWPRDLLALMLAHQVDFFVGDAVELRDRPARSMLELGGAHPHAGFVLGMQSFGLEETGQYRQAEAVGNDAVVANRDDVWAIHAVTHCHEMQGAVDEGIRFLGDRVDDWGDGNFFAVHNWWHLALFHLEAGDVDGALAIYDRSLHHDASACVPLEMLDASALLWRLHLDGVDIALRADALAGAWAAKADDDTDAWYVFNDVHAVMAMVAAGQIDAARRVSRRLDLTNETASGSTVEMTRLVGAPLARALVAFGEDRFDAVVDELLPVRRGLHRFGGSNAQRDVFQRTLVDAALRSGRTSLARSLVDERLGSRPSSVYGWTRRSRALDALGRVDEAVAARRSADEHQARFAATLHGR
jgi:tetratricopeptide (TPR) repeat protein